MKEYVGKMEGIILFPDNIKNNQEKCDKLFNQLVDKFTSILEENECSLFSLIELEENESGTVEAE